MDIHEDQRKGANKRVKIQRCLKRRKKRRSSRDQPGGGDSKTCVEQVEPKERADMED